MNLRLIDREKDYPELSSWWTKRGIAPVPLACLPSLGVIVEHGVGIAAGWCYVCLLYTSPSPRDRTRSRMPSSA